MCATDLPRLLAAPDAFVIDTPGEHGVVHITSHRIASHHAGRQADHHDFSFIGSCEREHLLCYTILCYTILHYDMTIWCDMMR